MNNREMDRILRERLENFELPPPMHLWDEIAAARAGGKRPAFPWIWWGSGFGVLALTAGIGLWLMFGQTSWTPGAEALAGHQTLAVYLPATAEASIPACPDEVPAVQQAASHTSLPAIAAHTPAKKSKVLAPEAPASETPAGKAPALGTESPGQELPASTIQRVSPFEGLHSAGLGSVVWKGPKDGFPGRTCNAFGKEKWMLNWNLELVASPEYVFRSLSSKSQEFGDYAGSRDKMEEIRGGFTAGLRISAVTDFGVSLRTGIQYGQINEVLNFRDPNDGRIIVTDVYDLDGNFIGTDTTYVVGTHVVITYNRHRMIDVPVMAGYEFQFPRFSMVVHGGVLFNLMFEQKGKILGPEGQPVAVTSGLAHHYPAFRDNLGMSLAGSIGFNYRLTPDIQFIVEPQFRIILDPVTRPGYPLNQDYFLTGVHLGVRKRL